MSIVTLTFDLWPPKSIGCILSSWWTCLPSLTKKYATMKTLSHSQGPRTDRRTEPQQRCAGIMKKWLLKSNEEAHNAGQISDPYVRGTLCEGTCDYRTDRHTHRQTPDKVIPMCRYASQATQKRGLFDLFLFHPGSALGGSGSKQQYL